MATFAGSAMMTADVIAITLATAADAERFPAIERDAGLLFESHPDLAWIAQGEDRSVADYCDLIAHGFSWWAGLPTGEAVGFICCSLADDELHVRELAVRMSSQRRGIGRMLIDTAAAAARVGGLSALTLTTFRDVPWNAPYYERIGFSVVPEAKMPMQFQKILDEEAQSGLRRDLRCVMRLVLRQTSSFNGLRYDSLHPNSIVQQAH